MAHDEQYESEAVSRRGLLTGIGVAAGAGAILGLPGAAGAGAPPRTKAGDQTEILGATKANLTYLPIDAFAFHPTSYFATSGSGWGRYYDNLTGLGVLTPPGFLRAPLLLPTGSVVRQLNVAFQNQPIISIEKRLLVSPQVPEQLALRTLDAGPGTKTQTIDLDPVVPIAGAATYTVTFFCSAGDTISGVTVGYEPAAQTFIPFSGAVPRVYDTRDGAGKLGPGEERTIPLGFAGARSAVINLTVDGTEGAGGVVSAFRADIAWPGSSSLNWSAAGQILANTTVVAMDAAGQIKIRGGAARTHVVIDRIGWLI